MTLTLLQKNNRSAAYLVYSFLLCVLFFLYPQATSAQSNGLSLSVTPTLFQMSVVPGQSWQSGVKVINSNPFPLTVYAQAVNFAPQGESGEGKFIPVFTRATEGTTLAEWINLSGEHVTIDPEQTATVPFSVSVPENAAPGGHFAAILIGTKPPESEEKIRVSTSQVVTSLFFVRIAGDVQEQGQIREFTTTQHFVQSPHADFEVRFENKGNVHLQPQGQIVITNMWGKERGSIPINTQTHFGNVLPQSIRKFEFSWSGEPSFSDIGRYKAVITLGFGSDEKQFETRTTYFYVVPIKATALFFGSLISLVLLVRWSITAYVRRMLLLSGIDPELTSASAGNRFMREGDVRVVKKNQVQAPLKAGILDFKTRLQSARAYTEKFHAFLQFLYSYRVFFSAILGIALCATLVFYFVFTAQTDVRDYEITIENPDTPISLSSEDVLYAEQNEQSTKQAVSAKAQEYTLTLVNSSSVPGAAAKLAMILEGRGYIVHELESDFDEVKKKTVVVYSSGLEDEALSLSAELSGALLSAYPHELSGTPTVTVYIGDDTAL